MIDWIAWGVESFLLDKNAFSRLAWMQSRCHKELFGKWSATRAGTSLKTSMGSKEPSRRKCASVRMYYCLGFDSA